MDWSKSLLRQGNKIVTSAKERGQRFPFVSLLQRHPLPSSVFMGINAGETWASPITLPQVSKMQMH